MSVATPEPGSMTTGDLAALVVGCALALALPWVYPPRALLHAVPSWDAPLPVLSELAGKSCLALAVVALARRARYGGPIRPVEILGLACASPTLLDVIYYGVPGVHPHQYQEQVGVGEIENHWDDSVARRLHWTALFALAGGLLVLVAGRRRLPSAAVYGLAFVAILGFDFGVYDHLSASWHPVIEGLGFRSRNWLPSAIVGVVLLEVLPAVPIGVLVLLTWRDRRRRDRPAWPWVTGAIGLLAGVGFLSRIVIAADASEALTNRTVFALALGGLGLWAVLTRIVYLRVATAIDVTRTSRAADNVTASEVRA